MSQGRARVPLGSVVHVAMLGTCAVGLALVAAGRWYAGAVCVGVALATGGVARLLLPERLAGWLRVRRRLADAATLGTLAVVVVVMAVSLDPRR